MANIKKLEFVALDISGGNYHSWKLEAKIHLDARGLGDTIKEKNEASIQDKAKAMVFLRHHIHKDFKLQYLTVNDPQELWINLKERFDHLKTIMLPKALNDWNRLRFQDFGTVTDYNSEVFKIVSELKMCGKKITNEDLIEKTLSTIHDTTGILRRKYREMGFKKYSELISCLVAEQNNELFLKTDEARTMGYVSYEQNERGRGNSFGGPKSKKVSRAVKWNDNNNKQEKRNVGERNPRMYASSCHLCGTKGHWAYTCRTPRHLVELYQASIKNKGKVWERM